jgi:hypothetical protein
MPEFNRSHSEMDDAVTNATRATARLPGLDIEIVHRRVFEDDAEQISINLRAAPSFEAFGRTLDAANPFAVWAQATQLAWQPWLTAGWGAAWAMALPWSLALPRPSGDGASHSAPERGSACGPLHLSLP